ncbi:chromate transporter, partial [Propylenella binzhouense]
LAPTLLGPGGGGAAADPADAVALRSEPPSWSRAIGTGLVWGAVWLVPVAALVLVLGWNHVFAQEAVFFSKTAAVSFGGAYAVLAYVAQQAVEVHRWLAPGEMLTGLGLAETTPGPLILVLVFVGFLGGFRGETGLDPYLAGTIGALVTVWTTFAPCFLWIFLGAPFIEALRGNRALNGALSAITAAVVGVIANLAVWFAIHVLFAEVGVARLGPVALPVPELSSFDWRAGAIALAAGLMLLRFRVGMVPTLAAAAAAGALLKLFGI